MGTRDEILDAAAKIMTEQGMARATTKEIAKAAGYSEAALYRHFQDKTALFLGVLNERLPGLGNTLEDLRHDAGSGTVRGNLIKVATQTIEFYLASFPIAASLFSSQELLTAHRDKLDAHDTGPNHPLDGLNMYLHMEQEG